MNFLCHAIPYLEEPLVAVSTGIPDWLRVADRGIRARGRSATEHLESEDDDLRCVARGVIRHHEDDQWFHGTEAFIDTNMQLAVQLRDLLPGDAGFRPTFVGHILIEMLLDAFWIRDDRSLADRYYSTLRSIPPATVQQYVNVITGNPTDQLTAVIMRFTDAAFLYDYLDHDKLLMRINQVLGRVGLSALPAEVGTWLPEASKLVESRRQRLLTPPDAASPFPALPSP